MIIKIEIKIESDGRGWKYFMLLDVIYFPKRVDDF